MSEYPIGSTAKVYYDIENNPRTLYWMVRNEPEWARSRIIEGEKAIAENSKLREVADAAQKREWLNSDIEQTTPFEHYKAIQDLRRALRAAGYLQEKES